MTDRSLIVSTGPRGRVERLLRGEIHADDLHELFFSMREESGGTGIIGEVANFLAHPTRTQGRVWNYTNNNFAVLKCNIPLLSSNIVTPSLPAEIIGALTGNIQRARKSTVQRLLGMNQAHAQKVLARVLRRSIPVSPGRVSKIVVRTPEESAVVKFAIQYIKGGSLFTEHDVFEDFCRALVRQGLLLQGEKNTLKQAKTGISLFTLTCLHNRKIDLGANGIANLLITPDLWRNLAIFARSEVVKDHGDGNLDAAVWVFETSLPVDANCVLGIAPLERTPFVGDFRLSPDIKLALR